jgi:PhoH-like ATPase
MTQSKSRVVSITSRVGKGKARASSTKLFVLDTNVMMHDPTSLYRFEEHDIFLPICTLEELDNNKKGTFEVNRNARQASRYLDELVSDFDNGIAEGIPLGVASRNAATGRLFLQTEPLSVQLPSSFAAGKADNEIIAVCLHLRKKEPKRHVVLVSKDINMRIKARALDVDAEDYFNDKVLEDSDLLYTGMRELPKDFWDKHSKGVESWQQGGSTFYKISGPIVSSLLVNEFVFTEVDTPFYARVLAVEGKVATLQTLRDFGHHKNASISSRYSGKQAPAKRCSRSPPVCSSRSIKRSTTKSS